MSFNLRIDKLLNLKNISRNQLANLLGIPQTTFNRYFKNETQNGLAQHLWDILKIFPDVRRDWLFFGEGDPFSDTQSPTEYPQRIKTVLQKSEPDMTAEVVHLRAELDEERKLNRKLTLRLLGEDNAK